MQKENIIEIKNLSVAYNSKIALHSINLSIKKGDFIAVVGENGAGKSTLLNAIAGILEPKKGEIHFNERYLDRTHPRSSFGFLSQKIIVDWYLDVWTNVVLYASLMCVASKEIEIRIEEALRKVGMWEQRFAMVDSISGGQQQRMQLAMVIVNKPAIYVLDEPTTGLDVKITEEIFGFLRQEQEKGKTIIVSSHKLDALAKYCCNYIFLQDGKINTTEFYGKRS